MGLPLVERLTGALGALVHEVDLSESISELLINNLRDSLLAHLVLVFPQQAVSPEHHVKLGKALGELEPRHPLYPIVDDLDNVMVIENGPERPPDNEMWHADMTFRPHPPHCSLLQAQVLPEVGGDTMFANMYAVYEDLSEEMGQFLTGLTARHDVRTGFSRIFEENNEVQRAEDMDQMSDSDSRCIHPVIVKHPITGRPYLNVNETFTNRIIELPEEESKAILEMLFERVRHPRYQVRHRWSVGDLVIWDNLATQHFAVGEHSEYRCMHRVTVKTFDSVPKELAR